jgi:hypothetical protein
VVIILITKNTRKKTKERKEGITMSTTKKPKVTITQLEDALEERERPDRRASTKAPVVKDRREKDRRTAKKSK